jgi:16S rRNA (cytosine967-C5)-methyltransferase
MQLSGRIAAAIEVLADMTERHRPAATALSDWGKAHRFAGSGDRAVIANLVYDALRRRASSAWRLDAETPRAWVLGALATAWRLEPAAIAALCNGEGHAPPSLTEAERAGLARPFEGAPEPVRAEIPAWLWPAFVAAFGERAIGEGAALAERAPIDLRINTLKATRDKVLKALAHAGPVEAPLAPHGVRIPPRAAEGRSPNVEAEAAHGKGWYEVQDAGSQVAAALARAEPRAQVLDLCAGAGGKTLALAAAMQNTGQIYAYDSDKSRLRPIFERLKRAAARNVQVMTAGDEASLDALGARFDLVLVDAPCTGTGVWRRRPDAKWRLKPEAIEERRAEQAALLDRAARHVGVGGRIVYVTCSLVAEENGGAVAGFLSRTSGFNWQPWREAWTAAKLGEAPDRSADGRDDGLLLTPASHASDGFFVATLVRTA